MCFTFFGNLDLSIPTSSMTTANEGDPFSKRNTLYGFIPVSRYQETEGNYFIGSIPIDCPLKNYRGGDRWRPLEMTVTSFPTYLHWSFENERVLLPFIALESFGGFLLACLLSILICLLERYFICLWLGMMFMVNSFLEFWLPRLTSNGSPAR
jgi:hypothetical protein